MAPKYHPSACVLLRGHFVRMIDVPADALGSLSPPSLHRVLMCQAADNPQDDHAADVENEAAEAENPADNAAEQPA